MRIDPIKPDQLRPEQKCLYDVMRTGIESKFQGSPAIAENDALLLPWAPGLKEPEFGGPIWSW